MTARARKPPALKPPKLPAAETAPVKPREIRPLASVPQLADAVSAGHADLVDMTPVEGQPALVDISWKATFPDGKRAASILRTSRQAANLRGIAA